MGKSQTYNTDTQEIVVSIDLGSSLTKIIWGTPEETHFLTMEPEIIQCDNKHLATYRSKRISLKSNSADDAWVNLKDNCSQSYVVGFLASVLLAEANLAAPKYESALYKVLAVLGIIAEQTQGQFKINLTILLPYSEWNDQSKLKEDIGKTIKEFWFRGRRLRLRLTGCQCLPEGVGVTMSRYHGLSKDIPSSVVTLVFGHRNTSLLEFQRGIFRNANTTNLGFFRLVDQVIELSSGQERHGLHEAIFQLSYPVQINNPLLNHICKSTAPGNLEAEKNEIIAAINTAHDYYWTLISDWLDSKLPKKIHEIIIVGGAAQYLQHKLRERFANINCYWGGDWLDTICCNESFQNTYPDEDSRETLAFRIIDAYTAYFFQLAKTQKYSEPLLSKA